MKLINIKIENFKSIKSEIFDFNKDMKDKTYSLIGINESGKSSILQAIALKNGENIPVYPDDFYEDNREAPVSISFLYELDKKSLKDIRSILIEKGLPAKLASRIMLKQIELGISFSADNPPIFSKTISLLEPKLPEMKGFYEEEGVLKAIEKIPAQEADVVPEEENVENQEPVDVETGEEDIEITEVTDLKEFIENNLIQEIFDLSHKVTFWKSESKYLITEDVNMDAFSANPSEVSIPLRNCFELAEISDIPRRISMIKGNSSQKLELARLLSAKVTEHIKRVWPDHMIKIEFQINEDSIAFLVTDDGVDYKNKKTKQRSDGFQQFVSFLLTISAENSVEKINNTILLLDEPETHIHPQGQKDLLEELINITNNKRNNIVIFATHSNYMIDKQYVSRCKRIVKKDNKNTVIEDIDGAQMSYAKTNYKVFAIATSDYHNELYGYLHAKYIEDDPSDKDREYITNFDKNFLKKIKGIETRDWVRSNGDVDKDASLSTYIRNCINHPEAAMLKSETYSDEELKKSIAFLEKIKKDTYGED